MKNNIGWDKALGIGIEIAPNGQRGTLDGHGYYSELALLWETWLRDVKGFPEKELINYNLNTQLRIEFFNENIENHPEWFSDSGVSITELNGEQVYVCKGCQEELNGTSLYTHKHK